MARFRGTVQGGRGQASQIGHRSITTDANGWDLGVNVDGGALFSGDHFTVYATGGSTESHRSHKIAIVEEIDRSVGTRVRRITLFDREGNTVMVYTV